MIFPHFAFKGAAPANSSRNIMRFSATRHESGTINITTSCHGIRIIRCISIYIYLYLSFSRYIYLSVTCYTKVRLTHHHHHHHTSSLHCIHTLLISPQTLSLTQLLHTPHIFRLTFLFYYYFFFFIHKMENSDLLTVAASIAVIIWSVVMNTLYDAEQHREKKMMMISKGRRTVHVAVSTYLPYYT